jgi:hypothetical protein
VRRVERHERQVRQTGRQDDPRRFRVDPDVELGRRRRVPRRVGATHDHRLRDAVHDPRLELDGHSDVRERPDRHERDRLGRRHVRVDQELDRALRLFDGARRRDRQLARVHAAVPMEHVARDGEVIAQERRGSSLVDRNVDAEQVEDPKRVVGAVRDRVVAVDRRRGDQLEIGMERGQHQGDRVVRAGVDVEDQLPARRHA